MKALSWLILALFQIFWLRCDIISPLENAANALHGFCLSQIGKTELSWFYEAMLFGSDSGLRKESAVQAFLSLGLFHIIVVSGSHLVTLSKLIGSILPRSKWAKILTSLFLLLFTACNRFQSSCTRAYVTWVFAMWIPARKLYSADLQILSTLLCILIKPQWASALSFQLSCAASAALGISSSIQLKDGALRTIMGASLCVFLTAPLLFQVNPCISWMVIPANVLLLPVLEWTLLPLALTGYAFPPLRVFTEPFLKFTFGLLDGIHQFSNASFCHSTLRSSNWGAVYILTLYLVWRLLLTFYFRKRFLKSQKS